MTLRVDVRWTGGHGIARYGREVLGRLTLPYVPFAPSIRPGSPRDLVTPRLGPSSQVLYSPGFNAAPARFLQVVTVHDLIHLTAQSVKYATYYSAVLKPAIKKAGTVFTVSETSRRAIDDWLGQGSTSVVVTGNGCSEEFRPQVERGNRDYLLFVGNLKPHKNFSVLLEALRLVPAAQIIAVTPSPEAVRDAAGRFGVGDRVIPLSGLSDREMQSLYVGAAATVIPSLLEGFGLPALESICCGTGVIYSRQCLSVGEIVGDSGTAVLSATDPAEWADAISGALSQPMGADAESAARNHSWDRVAAIVEGTLAAMGGQ